MGESLGSKIAGKISSLGAFLAFIGAMSSIITFFDYEVRLLAWINLWGSATAWGIRLALIVVGGGIFLVASGLDKSNSPEAQAAAHQARVDAWERLKSHPRVQQFLADAAQMLRLTWDPSADANTYQVRQFVWMDSKYNWIDAKSEQNYSPDHPQVTTVQVYLERQAAPQRLVVTQDLTTRQLQQAEANAAGWSMMVG
jgi:hypothetical protein